MKRTFFFLTLALVLLPLSIYGVGNRQQTTTGGKPEISITILDRARNIEGGTGGTIADNRWTRWINENSPVNVRFVPVLRTEAVQRINALFAAGTAPDVVYEYGKPFMDNLFSQGVIQPVGDYVQRYSTDYKNYLNEHQDILPYLYAEDGQMYGMSSRRGITDLYIFGWYIRKDWLDKFNMPVPTHIDELLTFMRRVRDEDPDGNGVRDTYGMAFFTQYLNDTRAIFGAPFNDFVVENGRFVDWTSTPAYRDYLAFWAQLYSEGLIDPEFITDMQATRQLQHLTTGKAGVYFGQRPSNGTNFFAKELRRNVPTADLITFDPPATNYGKFAMQMQERANYMAVMNRSARNPQAIMQYVDWMISGGWWNLEYGFEGRHYNLVNGVPIRVLTQSISDEIAYTGDYGFVNQLNPQPFWFATDVDRNDPLSVEFGQRMADFFTLRLNDRPRQFVPYAPSGDRIAQYTSETSSYLSTQVQTLEIAIIIGRIPLDAGIQQINNFKNSVGWAQVNADKDAWYQRNRNLFTGF